MDIKSTFGSKVSELAKNPEKKADGAFGQQVSELAHAKKETGVEKDMTDEQKISAKAQMNKQILEASVNVSIESGDKAMQILYQEAIESINVALEGELGPNAIQNAYDSGLDVSPEATADRIVSLTTAFFGAYQEQHPDMALDEQLSSFVDVIGGGIAAGIDEARDILSGLGVLGGDIASNIDKTQSLVEEGLLAFVESHSAADDSLEE